MSFVSVERLPDCEMAQRVANLRRHAQRHIPQASGILVCARLSIYHLCGSWANGVLWVPMDPAQEPVLLCRKGRERSILDSPLAPERIVAFTSYGQLAGIVRDLGAPLVSPIGVEMNGLSWTLGELLRSRLAGIECVSADAALSWSRTVKTSWELEKLTLAGQRHNAALTQTLPQALQPGMTEHEIALAAWDAFYAHGHQGMMRMHNHGEEIFLGHVAAGDSGNYPSVFNGPLGLRGSHPVLPFMGYAGKIWHKHEPLALDCGFCLEGYHSDKTQIYWHSSAAIPDAARKAQDMCLHVHNFLAENLLPGAIPAELYQKGMDLVRKAGLEHGFMGLGGNKVGFLGHGIGLAIDEWPVIAPSFTTPLEENMVLAMEPKMGIDGLGMVGLEDTFVVTPAGGRCLTGSNFSPIILA